MRPRVLGLAIGAEGNRLTTRGTPSRGFRPFRGFCGPAPPDDAAGPLSFPSQANSGLPDPLQVGPGGPCLPRAGRVFCRQHRICGALAEPAKTGKEELMMLVGMYPTEWDLPKQDKKEMRMLLGMSVMEWEKRAREERGRRAEVEQARLRRIVS
jgi:hypothetical protein